MSEDIYIQGGRLLDPAFGENRSGDLFITHGHIAEIPSEIPPGTKVVDARNLVVAPGFIDLHVHLREPGGEQAETIETGSRAAARGGFTTIVAMPNTRPPIDSPDRVTVVKQRGREVGLTRVIPSACITLDRKGEMISDIPTLMSAGAKVLTDDGTTVQSDAVMQEAMRVAWEFGIVIMDHAQDHNMEKSGVMHEGEYSRKWGLPGIPSEAEIRIVERDIRLAEKTGCTLHIQHVTTAGSCELIRKAREQGVQVTGELTPHHLALADGDIDPENANFKMNPPLRSERDREALTHAICDGVLSIFATDHAPHTDEAKAKGFREAPFGVVGLETAVGITYSALVRKGLMNLTDWVARWTVEPAHILGLPVPNLQPGSTADIVLLDLKSEWTVHAKDFASRSRNTPFEGQSLVGRAVITLLGGEIVWEEPHLLR